MPVGIVSGFLVFGGAEMAFNVGNRPIRVAVGVGHANLSGGNQYELKKNREVMAEFLKLARESTGFDIRCYTPNNGQGTYPGTLDAVVYGTVHVWLQQGWRPDVVFEIHHEGLANTAVRGGFVIYPDADGLYGRHNGIWGARSKFVDTDVVEAGPGMARIITQALGVPLRSGTGLMSERHTGVGGDGFRLGYFGALSDPYFQQNAAVFITEAATYTNPTDRAIMERADFAPKEARALFEALAYLGKERGNWTFPYKIGGQSPAPAPKPTNPFEIGTRMKATDALNVRVGWGLKHTVSLTLRPGDEVEVIADSAGATTQANDGYVWVNIAGDWGTGWAASNWLEVVDAPDPPAPPRDTFTTRYELPFRRDDYGFNAAVTATLPVGTTGSIISGPEVRDNIGWYRADVDGHGEGWLPASILRTLDIEGGDA